MRSTHTGSLGSTWRPRATCAVQALRPASMRSNVRWTNSRSHSSSIRSSFVCGVIWIATSVSNGIATTADAIREELLRLAKQMPNSPLANAAPDEVTLADGKLVSRRDASRTVSIADAMRHGAVERIEQEKTTNPSHD